MLPESPMSISAILNSPSDIDYNGRHPPKLRRSLQLGPIGVKEKTAESPHNNINTHKFHPLSAGYVQKVQRGQRNKKEAHPHVTHAPSAQVLYIVTMEGLARLRPIPVAGEAAWESLPVVSSAALPRWTVNRGDIVTVDIGQKGQGYAKVSDLRRLSDGRYVVVYAWLYTRSQIAREMEIDADLPALAQANIDTMWPPNAAHELMLSTNRTITMWDTAIARAPRMITESICQYAIYNMTTLSRQIVGVDHPRFQWMREILMMKPDVK